MKKLATVLSILVLANTAVADDMRAALAPERINDESSSVSRASEAYRNLVREGKVPQSVLKNAKCVAVFPSVVTAALGVGGTHGDGVAFCKSSTDGKWGNPVFLDLTGGSIGVQAGVKSADIVLYMTGDKARENVQNGSFRLAGDLSAVAGNFEKTFVAPPSGIVAYANTSGAFAGASLVGVDVSHDEDEQKAFYGSYDRNSVFEGKIPAKVERAVNELRDLLPSA